jgi:hypothetical protein
MAIDDPKRPNDEIEIPNDELEAEDGGESESGGDAGQDDDEGGDEAEGRQDDQAGQGEEGQVEEPPARKPGRAERAVLEAKKAAREAVEAKTALEREIASMRAERAQPKQETEDQERARLQLMTTDERVTYMIEKAAKQNAHQIGLMRFESADRADKASYEAKATYDPRYKRFEADVVEQLAQARRAGLNPDRETVLKYVIGEKVLGAKPKVDKARQDGQKRIARQQATASSGRSDRQTERARGGNSGSLSDLERRLDGVRL